jgi:DNA-binding XRE family transcriptional regulator
MTSAELRARRLGMGKTQRQMAELVGVSLRAVHSFEQGWRKVPVYVERQILFLAMLAHRSNTPVEDCWKIKRCRPDVRAQCPAWELKAGQFCWFINGTLCAGKLQRTWKAKMEICRRCKVFQNAVPAAVAG